jgi:hypothetical protein
LRETNYLFFLMTIYMLDDNIVSDNTDDLSSLFDGSVTADVSVATMPTGTRGSTELTSGVDDAVDNQQDWYDFDGDINDLLSSRPPTYLRQSKLRKSCDESDEQPFVYHYKCDANNELILGDGTDE